MQHSHWQRVTGAPLKGAKLDFTFTVSHTSVMPRVYPEEIKQLALNLRSKGFSYTEIQNLVNYNIPKNTMTGWFKNIVLTQAAQQRIINKIKLGGAPGRAIAWKNTRERREKLLKTISSSVNEQYTTIDKNTAKIILAMLYWAEGGKIGEFVKFGNSDVKIVRLFLHLLRKSFNVNEQQLRGKVQCRADQNSRELEKYWSEITEIPLNQFHKAFIDKRTINKPTKRVDYKGVFVIIYCSNRIFLELKYIAEIVYNLSLISGPVVYR